MTPVSKPKLTIDIEATHSCNWKCCLKCCDKERIVTPPSISVTKTIETKTTEVFHSHHRTSKSQ